MILSHQKFDFQNKCLIEKIIIQAPFRFTANFQNEACFVYFFEGNATINSANEQVPVQSGESFLLKCGSYFSELLQYKIASHYEILVFHLYPDILKNIYADELPSIIKRPKDNKLISKIVPGNIIRQFVEGLQFYFNNPLLVNDELLKLKIKELILLLLQSKSAQSVADLFADLFTPRNINIKDIIHNHLFSDLSVSDLAELANLSLSTFNRTFQTLYNTTPANYIKQKRLEKAKELLLVSSQTISEIAFNTGFKDVAHFSRSFKSFYHLAPSAYRNSPNAVV